MLADNKSRRASANMAGICSQRALGIGILVESCLASYLRHVKTYAGIAYVQAGNLLPLF